MMGLRETLEAATPGSWFFDSYATIHSSALVEQDADYTGVAAVWAGASRFNGGMASNPADARLIALAPELAAWGMDVFERHAHLLDDDLLNRWQEITGGE